MLAAVLVNLYDAYRLLAIPQGGAGLDSGQRASAALSAVDTFDAGFLLALVFFGVHQVVLGLLLCRSGYVPRRRRPAGGRRRRLCRRQSGQPAGGGARRSGLRDLVTPAVVGELGLTAWLLLKGVTTEPPPARAVAAAPHPVR